MGYDFGINNPGLGGLEELTAAEEAFILAAVSGVIELLETSAPSATSGYGKLYVKSSDSNLYFKDDSGTETQLTGAAVSGANTALSNLASVAINAALVLGTSDAFALGSATKMWSDLFLADGGVINFNNGNFTATHSAGALAFSGSISASNLSGTNTGDQTSVSGNAGTATALQNARTIGGVSFDGTANITVASATGGFAVSGAALTVGAGLVGTPSIAFTGDLDNGIYYIGTNNWGLVAAGAKVLDISSTGLGVTGTLAMGTGSITMTGSLAATGSRVTKGWFTDIESTNMPTVGGTAILTSLTAPQFTTIELGHASDTTLSRVSAGVAAIEGNNIITAATTATRTMILTAAGGKPTTTAGCAAAGLVEAGTNDVDYWTLDFDATTKEYAVWNVVMPDNYDGGTVTARFLWTTTSSTTSHTVVWGLAGRVFGNDDAIDQAFGTAQEVSDDVLAAGDVHITAATSAITLGGTPAGGKFVVFRAYRDPANGSDDLNVDARLLAVHVEYGINAYSD